MVNGISSSKHIVCLGGGIGTVNLLKGLKKYTTNITTIISMADDGGSAGRLRRLYNIMPLGDLVSCMAAMSKNKQPFVLDLLKYRFTGERYGKDHELGGHKLGNLIMVALTEITGNYENAIDAFKKLFSVEGNFLPATDQHVSISARNIQGKEIFGEEKIDLGKYKGIRVLEQVLLHPEDAKPAIGVIEAIKTATTIILGPGDLYTNLLPVVIVKDIAKALMQSKAKKIFIVNVANKPEETRGYKVQNYIDAIVRHVGSFPFDIALVNSNTTTPIPAKYHYHYVKMEKDINKQYPVVTADLVDKNFPLYHNPEKLAKVMGKYI